MRGRAEGSSRVWQGTGRRRLPHARRARAPTPLPSRAQIVFVVWLTLPPWRGASVLYLAFVAKYLEVLEPDIDLFAENTQQRVRDAWGNVRHRVASHVTRNAKEILGAVAQLLSDTAASTVQPGGARQPAGAGETAAANSAGDPVPSSPPDAARRRRR